MTNFNNPYFSSNMANFWSRWHISLSTWFKDYLYIPLGGNRVSVLRNYLNIFVTFLVSGIWHGANFTFVIWGGLHGLYLMVEKYLGIHKSKTRSKLSIGNIIMVVVTFILVDFAWIFFRANSVQEAILIVSKIFTDANSPLFIKWDVFFAAGIALSILFTKEFIEEFFPTKFSLL